MGPGGALEGAVEAREQGLVRFIGVTGHGCDHRGHAPAEPRPLRLRLGAAALQLLHGPEPAVPAELRGGARDLPREERRRPGHQVHRPRSVGGRGAHAHDLVPAARGAGRHRPRRPLDHGSARRLHQHRGGPDAAAPGARRREPFRGPASRRGDGLDAGRRPDDLAVRPFHLSAAPMPIYHVHFTCAPDYRARRLPFRPAHLKQLSSLREDGRVVAGGPEPDGTAANIFYRVPDEAALGRLLEENEFNRAGLFTAQHPRAFADFLEPIELPPIDQGLETTMVEGRPADHALARAALAALQRHGRVAFGGFFADGAGLAVLRCASTDQAVAWLAAAGGWEPGRLRGRPWSQTL